MAVDRKQMRQAKQARAQRSKPEAPAEPPPKPEKVTKLKDVPPPFGRGSVIWPVLERQMDRYGFVGLQDEELEKGFDSHKDSEKGDGDFKVVEIEDAHLDLEQLLLHADKRAKLVFTVVRSRNSPHMGDVARGIKVSTPKVGEQIVLGPGKLVFFEDPYSATLITGRWFGVYFGLMPDNPMQAKDWMDPVKLYRLLHQTVDVSILPV